VLKKLYSLLSEHHKKKFIFLLILYLPIVLLETLSIGSLPVFIVFILDPLKILSFFNNEYFSDLVLNLSNNQRALSGILTVAFLFLLKAIIILSVNYYELNFLKQMDIENSKKLFRKYVYSPFLFHVYNNPSELTQNLNDIRRTTTVIFGFSTIIREILIILSISFVIIFSNIKLFLLLFLLLFVPVIFLLTFFKNILVKKGEIARIFRTKRLITISESFNNIKFIKLRNFENFIVEYFNKYNFKAMHQDMISTFISKIPRIVLETFSILTILIIVYFLYFSFGDIKKILPILTLLIVSVVRLIPSVGNIIVALNNYKYNYASFKNFEILFQKKLDLEKNRINQSYEEKLIFNEKVTIKNISYRYPNKQKLIIENFNYEIKKNEKIGIYGKSGIGKSTLLNLILGLITPTKGKILCDNIQIERNLKNWNSKIGYVPQKITLFDETIINNICFGTDNKEIDVKHLDAVIKQTELEDFIKNLPEKFDTKVGHEGNIVSGGQLQRIGIARALYNKPEILILDEPTSSLDNTIEKAIIKSLFNIKEITIILVSHNKSIIEMCDRTIELTDKK
jgi:ABC-type bacteriocin/lantibiotic exporter with double-glycine peptidase domain